MYNGKRSQMHTRMYKLYISYQHWVYIDRVAKISSGKKGRQTVATEGDVLLVPPLKNQIKEKHISFHFSAATEPPAVTPPPNCFA